MPDESRRWQPHPVPEKFGGGFCVVLGEPDERLQVGRQIGGVPAGSMTHTEAQAIAKALNRLLKPTAQPEDVRAP